MQKTGINYLTHTWSPIVMRCSRVSPACDNCWHLKLCDRFAQNPQFPLTKRRVYEGKDSLYLDLDELTAPLHVKSPAIIGTQFMGDLFKEDVPDEMIDRAMAVTALCPQHKFIVLTKRAERLPEYVNRCGLLPDNLHLGVTVENQEMADLRIPYLLQTPAAKRILSVEPMLENIFFPVSTIMCPICKDGLRLTSAPKSQFSRCYKCGSKQAGETIDMLIVGCESGPNRRPTKLEWAESAVEQCKAAGVKVWVKQLEIRGKVTTDINQFPKHLQIRERP